MRRLLYLGILLCCVAAGVLWWLLSTPQPLPQTPFAFTVRPGSSIRLVARELEELGILRHEALLSYAARGLKRDTQIKAGNYALSEPVSVLELLDRLTRGEVTQRVLTIPEGSSFTQLREILRKAPGLRVTSHELGEPELLARLGAKETQGEGLFFPDTYFYTENSTDLELLGRAYRLMQERLITEWVLREPDLPLASPYEALILASIVEKETGRATDRALVAAVFINRLRQGMRLQTDPSVIYGLGERFDGNLRKRDLITDSAYNTYTRAGLPPTPIALPGLASLQAVLHPADTRDLYFVARGDGSSQFSTKLADHNRAVAKYQRGSR
ncbi:MAG: endolytic transglycosylase MltG [Betaproteobacteria bacterium]|nr:endolytic transglycosylase MltG [Betaproteobacteria bacterium]